MSGPQASPRQLTGVVPGAQAQAPEAPDMSAEEVRGHLSKIMPQGGQAPMPGQGASAPAQPDSVPDMTAEQVRAALTQAGFKPPEAPPAPSPLAQSVAALGSPLGALLDSIKGPQDAPGAPSVLSAFAKDAPNQQKIFQQLAGPGYESRVVDDEVEFRKAGEADSAWRPVKQGWFDSLHSFIQRTARFLPEALEGTVMGAVSAEGAVTGAEAGAAAGSLVPGAGTATGAALGGLGGAMAAGAVGSTAGAVAREAVARMLGADADPSLGTTLAGAAAGGALAPAVGALVFRKPMQYVADKLAEKLANSQEGRAIKVGALVSDFNKLYETISGGSTPTWGEAGKLATTAVEGAETKLGQDIGTIKKWLVDTRGDQTAPMPKFTKELEDTLQEHYKFQEVPRVTLDEPVRYQAIPKSSAPAELKELSSFWNKMANEGGLKPQELFDTLKSFQTKANYDSLAPTGPENLYRTLYSQLRQDRDALLQKVTQGTEMEDLAKGAYANYADSIDALRKLSRAAEKSPEKFAQSVMRDVQTVMSAKKVLGNPDASGVDMVSGWDAVKQAWMRGAMDAAKNEKTGIVDIPKFVAQLTKNQDVARAALEPEQLAALKGLAGRMDRVTWQGLLANPDAEGNQGIFRAMVKAVAAHGHPAYVANALGALTNYDPQILQQVQSKGILQFAQEATLKQERSYWMRTSNMINKMLDATTVPLDRSGVATNIPIEPSIMAPLLRGAVRPKDEPPQEQQAQKRYAYSLYQDHMAERARDLQAQIAREHVTGMPQFQMPKLAGAGSEPMTGIPGGPALNIFAGKRMHGVHLGKR